MITTTCVASQKFVSSTACIICIVSPCSAKPVRLCARISERKPITEAISVPMLLRKINSSPTHITPTTHAMKIAEE